MLTDKNVSFVRFGQVPLEDEKQHRPQGLDRDSPQQECLCKEESAARLLWKGLDRDSPPQECLGKEESLRPDSSGGHFGMWVRCRCGLWSSPFSWLLSILQNGKFLARALRRIPRLLFPNSPQETGTRGKTWEKSWPQRAQAASQGRRLSYWGTGPSLRLWRSHSLEDETGGLGRSHGLIPKKASVFTPGSGETLMQGEGRASPHRPRTVLWVLKDGSSVSL